MELNEYRKSNKNLVDNIELCEYIGCSRKASTRITISTEHFGNLILNLCSYCIDGFMQKQGVKNYEIRTL
ncbi:protein of unknown function [Candidatus Nitrosocosmicus franklandus]|uniref:Uncharacterized protein n=1 Tax=Candidatus Nitrosocosmicus franklandianus TaxID=1798806 RepID=A0A484I9R8_9ARCH|nr:protein of unknown function [Candidatus Nitrosocosmicus franklandus]